MTITTRFGDIDYEPNDPISFAKGLLGFPNLKRFLVVEHKPGSAFRWLQSLDEPSVAFLTCNPWSYVADYSPDVPDGIVREMGLDEEGTCLVLTTANIPSGRPDAMVLNLFAPILVNLRTRVAKQVTLDESAYTIRHRVFQKATPGSEVAAAQAA